jgi:hypothetical protein
LELTKDVATLVIQNGLSAILLLDRVIPEGLMREFNRQVTVRQPTAGEPAPSTAWEESPATLMRDVP